MTAIPIGETSPGVQSDSPPLLRIFLVDDHTVVRAGLKTLIEAQPDMQVVGEASSGRTALDKIRTLQDTQKAGQTAVDVVVMDVSMPDGGGTETTADIRQLWPQMPVLALTMHEDKSYLRRLLEAGASGYVLKRSAADELIRALRIVADKGTYIDPSLSSTVASVLMRNGSGPRANRGSLPGSIQGAALSEREENVLHLIAEGFTNKEIGVKLFLSVKTVETYKARSMEKLGLSGRADIVRYALAQGWLSSTE